MRVGLEASRECWHCQKGFENHEYFCTGQCALAFRRRVIGFCGPAGAGKSTAADRLVRRWRFSRVRFAGPLKAMMRALGLSEAQVDGDLKESPCELLCGRTPRQAMQWLGTEWGREKIDQNFWISAWRAAVDAVTPLCREPDLDSPVRLIVADDVRFPNEAAAIRAMGGIVVCIERPGAGSTSGVGHASERLEFEPDAVIINAGDVAALHRAIDDFALSIREG